MKIWHYLQRWFIVFGFDGGWLNPLRTNATTVTLDIESPSYYRQTIKQ